MLKNYLSGFQKTLMDPGSGPSGSKSPWTSARSVFSLLAGLIVFSLSGLMLLGGIAFDRSIFLQLGLIYGLFLMLLLFHKPQMGLILLLIGGIIISKEFGTGTETNLNGAFLLSPMLIGIWLIYMVYKRREYFIVPSRTVTPLYLFMIVTILAFGVGQYPWFPTAPAPITTQIAQLAIFLFSCGIFWVAAYQLQDMRWLQRITYLFIGLGFLNMLVRLDLGPIDNTLSRFLPRIITGGSSFWTWLVALSFGQAVLNRNLHTLKRVALAALSLIAIVILLTQEYLQSWVSGWAPVLLAVFIILLFRFPVQVLIASPVLVLAAILKTGFLTGFASMGDNLYSLQTRFSAIKALMPVLTENPLLGLGPANYYQYDALFPIDLWYVRFNSHNTYIDLLAQVGLAGLFCFLWFAGTVLRSAWNLSSKFKGGFENAYAVSVFAGWTATLVAGVLGDWIFPFVYNIGIGAYRTTILSWIFIGGLIALEQRMAGQTRGSPLSQ